MSLADRRRRPSQQLVLMDCDENHAEVADPPPPPSHHQRSAPLLRQIAVPAWTLQQVRLGIQSGQDIDAVAAVMSVTSTTIRRILAKLASDESMLMSIMKSTGSPDLLTFLICHTTCDSSGVGSLGE